MNWISTKERLPEPFQKVFISLIDGNQRLYSYDRPFPFQLRNGHFRFGDHLVDFWQPVEEIK